MATIIDLSTIERDADCDPQEAAAIYAEHGCLVVRGLHRDLMPPIAADIAAAAAEARARWQAAEAGEEGWWLDGTLFIPAPAGHSHARQIMLVGIGYDRSAAMLRAALDPATTAIASAILGPAVELMDLGQVVYKEPTGGHAKYMHQDSAYFEHVGPGPLSCLTYVVDTDLQNGALHVVPGSHRDGYLPHIDTTSHLGLPLDQYPIDAGTPIVGRAGDAIFFHQHCIHGSPANHADAARPVCIHRYRQVGDRIGVHATTASNRQAVGAAWAAEQEAGRPRLMVCGRRKGLPPCDSI